MKEETRTVAREMRSQADKLAARAASLGPGQERLANRMDKQADAMRSAAKRSE